MSERRTAAVIVSRMDHPLGDVLDPIRAHVDEIHIVKGVAGVFERWQRAMEFHGRTEQWRIFTCDDDAVVDVAAVLAAYEPGVVTCNMPADRRPEYQDGCALVGWGAAFDADLVPKAFCQYFDFADLHRLDWRDAIFLSEADRVFTGLSTLKLIDVPFRHLPHAFDDDRMARRAMHGSYRQAIRERIQMVRGEK